MHDLTVLVPFVVGGAVLAVAAGVAVWSWQVEKKRGAALSVLADRLGYVHSPDGIDLGAVQQLYLFTQGREHRSTNALRGQEAEVGVTVFDYSYLFGSGKNRRTYRQTVVWLRWAAWKLPEFALRPEHLLHKLGTLFGYQDIDFRQYPEFSRQFLLRGPVEVAVRQLFNPVVVDFFQRRPGLSTDGRGSDLIVYRAHRRLPVEEIEGLIKDALDLAHRLPRSG